MIPQTDAENENEEAEQLIIHELDQISSPSVLVIYEAKENEADNSGQLTSPSQPQTPITTQTTEKKRLTIGFGQYPAHTIPTFYQVSTARGRT